MRLLAVTPILLLFLLLSAQGQEANDSTGRPLSFAAEFRLGANDRGAMISFEGRLGLFDVVSLDAGWRFWPESYYGGVSWYPRYPLLLQLQLGHVTFRQGGIDGIPVPNDFYGGIRGGIVVGEGSVAQFSLTCGGMTLVDFNRCVDCNGINPTPHYRDEVEWIWTGELGLGIKL